MLNRREGIVPWNEGWVDEELLLAKCSEEKLDLVHPVGKLPKVLGEIAGNFKKK